MLFVLIIKKSDGSLCLFFNQMNIGVIGETGVSVVTRISLEKKVSRSGQTYASYVFEVVEELSPEQSELAKEYSRQFMTALETAEAKSAKEVR